MSAAVLLCVAVVALALGLIALALPGGGRRDTYVCRTCHAVFSDPDQAFVHWKAMHER